MDILLFLRLVAEFLSADNFRNVQREIGKSEIAEPLTICRTN